MSLEPLRLLYRRSPEPLVKALADRPIPQVFEPLLRRAYPWWCGPRYRATAALLDAAESWTPSQTSAYQLARLGAVLSCAAARSPRFRRLLRDAELDSGRFGSLESLSRLPLMDRAVLRQVADEVQERGPDVPARLQVSGGTTSTTNEFLESRDAWAFEKAFFSRWYRQHGFVSGDRMITVTGTLGGRVIAYNPIANELNIYVHEFSDEVGDDLVSRIIRFNPRMIRGYPSLLYLLATHVLKRGETLVLPRLVAVFLSSETVLRSQVEAIEQAFRVPVTSHYGQGERIALIQRCPKGPLLHVAELYGYVEFLREDGSPATHDGDLAMVVGTSFANTVTPLIRYKTEDWVVVAGGGTCPDCHRKVRSVRSVEGRTGDFIVTPSGRWWSATVLSFAIDDVPHIREMCIVQKDLRSVEVLVVPDEGYVADDGHSCVRELETRVGEAAMRFTLVETASIPRPRSQKQRLVVSSVGD